jgi:hypothetical protein
VSVAKRDEQRRNQIVANDLTSDVAEHERTKPKTFIVKTTTLRKEIEAIHFEWSQETDSYATQQQKNSDDSKDWASVFIIHVYLGVYGLEKYLGSGYARVATVVDLLILTKLANKGRLTLNPSASAEGESWSFVHPARAEPKVTATTRQPSGFHLG